MAIDAKVLILDEPTLGLDIVNRKHFYTRLLEGALTRTRPSSSAHIKLKKFNILFLN